MIELWVGEFLPLIDNYSEMSYVLNPDFKEPVGEDTVWYWDLFTGPRAIFQKTDRMFEKGYVQFVIINLRYDGEYFDVEGYFVKDEQIR